MRDTTNNEVVYAARLVKHDEAYPKLVGIIKKYLRTADLQPTRRTSYFDLADVDEKARAILRELGEIK